MDRTDLRKEFYTQAGITQQEWHEATAEQIEQYAKWLEAKALSLSDVGNRCFYKWLLIGGFAGMILTFIAHLLTL